MTPYKAVMLDKDSCFADQLRAGQLVSLQILLAGSVEELEQAVNTSSPDVILLLETPNMKGIQVLGKVRKFHPFTPAILLCEAASGAWGATLDDKSIDVLCNPVSAQELQYRIAKLLTGGQKRNIVPYQTRTKVSTVSDLRNDESGRLDAKQIATVFGMTLADIARGINKSLQMVHRNPDAKSLQKALFPFERIASALLRITGTEKGLKVWLNAPNEAFPGKLPIELIIAGQVELLADMLEDVLVGHPD